MTRLRADLILLACAAIWGFAFLYQKAAMAHVGPYLFVAARSVVAGVALLPFVVMEQRRAERRAASGLTGAAIIAGIAFFLAAVLQQAGLVTASVTNTGFLTALYVVFTPFVAWMLIGRRPSAMVGIAVLLSFIGTWLLGGGSLGTFAAGDLLVALSAIFWATHVVLLGRAARFERPMTFTALQFAVVAGLGMVGAMAFEDIRIEALVAAAPSIAYVGLLSSALTFTLFAMALAATQPTEAAIIVSTETLFAALSAYLVLGERLSPLGWLGAGAILLATLVVQLAPSREASASTGAAQPTSTPKNQTP